MFAKRVVMLCKYIPQYRIPFLTKLHEACRQAGLDLKVIYGNPGRIDASRADELYLENPLLISGPGVGRF